MSARKGRRPRIIRGEAGTGGRSFPGQRQGIIQEQFPGDILRSSRPARLSLGRGHQLTEIIPDFRVLAGLHPGGVPEQGHEHLRGLYANYHGGFENPLIVVLYCWI